MTDLSELTDWTFATSGNGTVDVGNTLGANTGSSSLLFGVSETQAGSTSEGVVEVDLSGVSSATDLTLDFRVRTNSSSPRGESLLDVEASGDGLSWSSLQTGFPLAGTGWQHLALDLDAALVDAGITLDSDVFIKLKRTGEDSFDRLAIDDVQIRQTDLVGPRIVSMTPSTLTSGPVSAIDVTFNEPINAATFTTSDITIESSGGVLVPLSGNPVDSGDRMTFTLNLSSPQTANGLHSVVIGRNIADDAGNLMNQDGDLLTGESHDVFDGTYELGPVVAQSVPVVENFEVADAGELDGWTFSNTGVGEVSLATGANSFLNFYQSRSSTPGTAQATLQVDLSSHVGDTDLSLDFDARRSTLFAGEDLLVRLSDDGQTWSDLGSPLGTDLTNLNYANYFFDLDAALNAAGIPFDAETYVQFHYTGTRYRGIFVDNVRIANRDAAGPSVVSATPVGDVEDPLQEVEIVFDKPMNVDSLAAGVELLDPTGEPVWISDPIDTGDQMTFRFQFVPQSLSGTFRLDVGSDARDVSGNPLNQDGDQVNGELQEDKFQLAIMGGTPSAQTIPYEEGFETFALQMLDGWSFETAEDGGNIQLNTFFEAHSGQYGLAVNDASATLTLDLTDQAGADDLYLDFWTRRITGQLTVSVSGDGSIWTQVLQTDAISAAGPDPDTEHHFFDLDQVLSNAGIALDSDVFVRFSGDASGYGFVDDLRIAQNDPAGPAVVSTTIVGGGLAPISQFEVTFDRPVDPSSVASDNVQIESETTSTIVSLPPSVSTDGRTLIFQLDPPFRGRGTAEISVGPNLLDTFGNGMNQDGDLVGSEETDDVYRHSFELAIPPEPTSFPFSQTFTNEPQLGTHWQLQSTHPDTLSVPSRLQMNSPVDVVGTNQATLAIDLAGRSNVTLAFSEYSTDTILDPEDGVFISDDSGATWAKISDAITVASLNRQIDLDAVTAAARMAYTSNFWIRFQQHGESTQSETQGRAFNHVRLFDEVPLVPASYPYMQNFEDEEALADHWSFESTHPDTMSVGGVLRMTSPMGAVGTSQATLAIDLAGQSNVTLSFGEFSDDPVLDPEDGIFISDDQGSTWAKIADGLVDSFLNREIDLDAATTAAGMTYTSNFWIRFQHHGESTSEATQRRSFYDVKVHEPASPTPASYPYTLNGDAALSEHWLLEPAYPGGIRTTTPGSLTMNAPPVAVGTNRATLAIDLAGQTDVTLSFREYAFDPTGDGDGVFISDDLGATWAKIVDGVNFTTVNHEIDLDAVTTAAGMTYTSNFWIRLQQEGQSDPISFQRVYSEFRVQQGIGSLSLQVPSSVSESSSFGYTARLTRTNLDTTQPLTVDLASSDPSRIALPPTVVIPANETFVDVPLDVIKNGIYLGNSNVDVSATAPGIAPEIATIFFVEAESDSNEPPLAIHITLEQTTISEGDNTVRAIISYDGDIIQAGFGLESSDPSVFTVPAQNNEISRNPTVLITPSNDPWIDGPQTATLTVTRNGFVSASIEITIANDDTLEYRTVGGVLSGNVPEHEYRVTHDIVVPADETLTLQAGAELHFPQGGKLDVYGKINAEGTAEKPVVFTSEADKPSRGDWVGIQLMTEGQGRSTLTHAEVAYAETGIALLDQNAGQLTVGSSSIHHHTGNGIHVRAEHGEFISREDVVINNSRIYSNLGSGVVVHSAGGSGLGTSASATLIGNEIFYNPTALQFDASYFIRNDDARSSTVNPLVAKNYLHDNGTGVRLTASEGTGFAPFGAAGSGEFVNNVLANNYDYGFNLTRFRNAIVNSEIANNTIVGHHQAAIYHDDVGFDSLTVVNNNIAGNARGIVADEPYDAPSSNNAKFNNLWQNYAGNFVNYPDRFGMSTHTNANGTDADQHSNISVDPMFLAESLFETAPESLVVGAGTSDGAPPDDFLGGLRYGAIDIGAYEVNSVTNVVTTLIDENDGALGLGTGNSLRELIQAANVRDDYRDVITFHPSLFGGTIELNGTELPNITDDLAIQGPGASLLTIDAKGLSGIFFVDSESYAEFSGLTMTGGTSGAISSQRYVEVADSVITGNSNTSNGGGISALQGIIVRSSIFDNATSGDGGGIAMGGTVIDSSIYDNTAGIDGGGIFVSGVLKMINSTVSGNQANVRGGGIHSDSSTRQITLYNSTVTNNQSDADGDGNALGGGIHLGRLTMYNSIVAGNVRGMSRIADDIFGTAEAASSHNLIGDAATAGDLSDGFNGNLIGVDPLLAPLGDYGGPTLTHALLTGSPAIDAGDNQQAIDESAQPLVTDQRGPGFSRIIDGNHSTAATVDIGAFESLPAPIVDEILVNDGLGPATHIDHLTIRFDQEVTFDLLDPDAFELTNTSTGQSVATHASLVSESGQATVVQLTFLPGQSVTAAGTLQDGNYRLTLRRQHFGVGVLDLDGSGIGEGGDHVFGEDPADGFFQLFGDVERDRVVDGDDFAHFGNAFLSRMGDANYNERLDYDGDGDIDGEDSAAFVSRFLKRL